jgi:Mor family transcriptional regulator
MASKPQHASPDLHAATPSQLLMRDAPDLLRDLYDQTTHLAKQRGLAREEADQLALALVDVMTGNWGGRNINFPKGTTMRLLKRDLAIWQEFDGRNHSDLAEKYDVTTVWVYSIIRKVRKLVRNEGQPGLF